MPVLVNVKLYAGDDFAMALTVLTADGSAADLSGVAVLAEVRESSVSMAAAATFSASVAGNVISLSLSHEDTADLPALGVWDCQILDSGGHVTTLVYGQMRAVAQVTR